MATPNPRARNVADLKANILNPSLTSTYETTFVFPTAVKNWMASRSGVGGSLNSSKEEKISLSCRAAALPETNLATHEQLNDFTGVTERHVYRRQYSGISSFEFYVDTKYTPILLFENWIKFIVNEDTSNKKLENNNYNYRVNFPDEYKSQIYIRKFEKNYANRNLEYTFLNAYPISINTMRLNYDASQVLVCTVNFNFSRYIVNTQRAATQKLDLQRADGSTLPVTIADGRPTLAQLAEQLEEAGGRDFGPNILGS